MRPLLPRLARIVCVIAALTLTLPAAASTPLGVAPIPDGTDTAVGPFGANTTAFFFIEGSPGSITIDAEDSSNRWNNKLTLDIHNPGLKTGTILEIRTALQVGTFAPTLAGNEWTGWTEQVLTADWQWIDGLAYAPATTPLPLAGATSAIQTTQNTNDTVHLGFDPLTAGDQFFATKQLQYTGPDIAPGDVFFLEIDILANPTVPEPSSLALLGLGGFMLARRRRA